MSKFFCALSGIECEVSYLPLRLSSREYAHPVFFLPKPKLLGLFSQYEKDKFTQTESYLLFLALFNCTDLVDFRVPAKHTPQTAAITRAWMEPLAEIVFRMDAIKNPSVQFPHFVISPETSDLKNAGQWIQIWTKRYDDFLEGNRYKAKLETLESLESKVHRLILDPNCKNERFALHLSNWAEIAASFPTFMVDSPLGNMKLSEYWKLIIRKSFNQKALFDIPASDIDELYNHCCDNLELGTTYSHALLNILKECKQNQIAYLGLGDLALLNGNLQTYTILDDSNGDVQSANMIAMISSVAEDEPLRQDYPSTFEYQRARIKWLAAQRNRAQIYKPLNLSGES